MKRLIVTGLPCPAEAWEAWLARPNGPEQRIVSLAEVFDNTSSSDLREMAKYVESVIESERPDSILCHGFGVSMTFISLLRLSRRGINLRPCLTIFNGALRRVSLRKSNHPLRAQYMTYSAAVKEVTARGGRVDPRLKRHFPRIRAMYRYIILFNFAELVASRLQLERFMGISFSSPLRPPTQMILSPDDPYLPEQALRQVAVDFHITKVREVRYGHFPYSVPPGEILPLVEAFERAAREASSQRAAHPLKDRPVSSDLIL